MPDPHKDLAPLIEPLPPPITEAGGAMPWVPAGAVVLPVLLIVLALAWRWRRTVPLRTLRRLARSDDPVAAAGELDRLIARHTLQPAPAWHLELERLRFAHPSPEAAATLARLCREAETLIRNPKGSL